jgi:hypothetical protein
VAEDLYEAEDTERKAIEGEPPGEPVERIVGKRKPTANRNL